MDGIRGIAILLVMLYHFGASFARGGHIGVDVFFVLSGFLITSLLCEEWGRTQTVDFRAFFRRRVLRLFPALFVMLLIFGVYTLVFPHARYSGRISREILMALFYSMNWFKALEVYPPGGFLEHTWSLSIEEQFYLIWPFVIFLLLVRSRKRAALMIVLLGMILSIAFRAVHWSVHENPARLYYGLDSRADGLLTGCLLGMLISWRWIPTSRVWQSILLSGAYLGALLILVLTFAPLPASLHYPLGMVLINLSTALLIAGAIMTPLVGLKSILQFPPLVWLGRISYGLYLWHLPVRHIFIKLDVAGSWWAPLVEIAASIAIAAASFYMVERRFLGLKRTASAPKSIRPPEAQADPKTA